jgi:hypothetical protein
LILLDKDGVIIADHFESMPIESELERLFKKTVYNTVNKVNKLVTVFAFAPAPKINL